MINLNKINKAKPAIRSASDKVKNNFLKILGQEIYANKDHIIKANRHDLTAAKKSNFDEAFIERLVFSDKEIKSLVDRLASISKLKAGLDEVIEEREIRSGLTLKKVRVPIGVILIIYESRPEVTIDVAALCVKSGNTVILKGGSEALNTNIALYGCIKNALAKSGLPDGSVTFLNSRPRSELFSLLRQDNYIDLVIARGGYNLVNEVKRRSLIPVLAHAAGGARYYIDKSASTEIINNIIINAKTSKPAACNSADAVLIHKDLSGEVIISLVTDLLANGVKIKLDDTLMKKIKKTSKIPKLSKNALNDVAILNQKDFATEFLSKTMIIKSVNSVEDACEFIEKYGKKHSEGIIAENKQTIEKFRRAVDAAAVFINCSTRFHDGFEFGLGAEMGISTGKLHARGPVGLKELTTYSWEVYGNGQIRI